MIGKFRTGVRLLAASALLLFGAVLLAQQPKPAEPKYTEFTCTADKTTYRWKDDDRVTVLMGNVKIVHGDTVILADKVDYLDSTKTATTTGNLKIYDERNTVTGETCSADFNKKLVTITGKVRMSIKPKPKADASDKNKPVIKDEVTITCDSVQYFYKEKKAVVPSSVTIVQKSRTVTADSATYLGKDDVVQLAGDVKGRDEKDKHSFSAPKVTVSLRDEDQWIEAERATGTFYIKEEEESEPAEATEE